MKGLSFNRFKDRMLRADKGCTAAAAMVGFLFVI